MGYWRGGICLVYLIFGIPFLGSISAQVPYQIDQTIPVQINGLALVSPWAGGLNSAQINSIDLNQDGAQDLAIFDRTSNKIYTFLRQGNRYSYAPDYESLFPDAMDGWVLLRDFNCDGRKDLFTSDPTGVNLFINTTSTGGNLKWRPAFNPGGGLLSIGLSGNPTNVKVNQSDLPAIEDIDNDGDLDILNAVFAGFGSIQWQKNLTIEKTGRCDSMQLQTITNTWGNFEECNCGLYAFSPKTCAQLLGGRTQHNVGKSILTLDINHDGVRDLLFSEQSCDSLYLLANKGTPQSALVNNYVSFPAVNPVVMLAPAGFYEDVDFDGVKDLIVSTNTPSRVNNDFDFAQSVWLYKNSGTDDLPSFSFIKKNFLQDQMIDVGDFASPDYADFDQDGDMDLFVSQWTSAGISSVYLFENTGSVTSPSFQFVTRDYGGLAAYGFINIKIQIIDINADGLKDLAFTATLPATGSTALYYLSNKGSGPFDFSGQVPIPAAFTLQTFENVLLYDVNHDGVLDILLGKTDGSLQYWKNNGSSQSMIFTLENNSFLGLSSSVTRFSVTPYIMDVNNDKKMDLIYSDQSGQIYVFNDFETLGAGSGAVSIQVQNVLLQTAAPRNLGGTLRLTSADLYNNSEPMITVGTLTGGLLQLKPGAPQVIPDELVISIWPNPVRELDKINILSDRDIWVQFFSLLGQKISDPLSVTANQNYEINQSLNPGLYVAKIVSKGNNKTYNLKFLVK